MKCYLGIFVLFLLICSICSITKKSTKTIITTKRVYSKFETTGDEGTITAEPEVYFQKIYSGSNPLKIINLSDSKYNKYTASVNKQLLVLKTLTTDGSPGDIFDTLVLKDIYSELDDDASKSKCCQRMKLFNYQGCTGECKKIDLVGFEAINCLEITVDPFTWRLCSESNSLIQNIQFQIKVSIINTISNSIDYKALIENSFAESKLLKNWDWHNQLTWGPQCINSSSNLQSPIILDNPEDDSSSYISNSDELNTLPLKMDYYFEALKPTVTSFGREIIVGFHEYIGLLRVTVGDKFLVYQPNFISFRFKSEHQISTKRFDGEIELHLTEVNPDKKSWITNGLVVSIFIEVDNDSPPLAYFDALKMDFWKLEIKDKNQSKYSPGNPFCLESLFDDLFAQNPKYYFYKGSLTTPPCTDNVLRIVFDKTLKMPDTQFKVLREQSLLDNREKEVHARISQKSLKREIITNTFNIDSFNISLGSFLDNNVTSDLKEASKSNLATANNSKDFSPAKREKLRDAVIKFTANSSIDQLQSKLQTVKEKSSLNLTANLVNSDNCE